MKDLIACVGKLRIQLDRHRKDGLKEYPTRTIFIDPLLVALGWDVLNPDDVELEHPTIDSKSVDYAMKIDHKVVLHIEAKQLLDPLEDVKSITQIVGYAANDGIEWCVLTNGVKYKVFKVSEKVSAPQKLLFEVSIDPNDTKGINIEDIAGQLSRISRNSLASGQLDQLGRDVFLTAKIRKALDFLFTEKSDSFIRLVRKQIGDNSVSPSQIGSTLGRIWDSGKKIEDKKNAPVSKKAKKNAEYDEKHHVEGKPTEVVELYRGIDRFCQNINPGKIIRSYKAKYISWALEKAIFCCVHIQQSGLRIWVKTDPSKIDEASASFARDVRKIGHWGVGDVELAVSNLERLRDAEAFILKSYESATRK